MGTSPDHQRRGVGSALLRHVLTAPDARAFPAYLDAFSEASRDFYAHHGFVTLDVLPLPDGPNIWHMRRSPGEPSTGP